MLKITDLNPGNMTNVNGKWVPARPLQIKTLWSRIKDAWAVFTDKADAVTWNG